MTAGVKHDAEAADQTDPVVAVPCEGDDVVALFGLSSGVLLGEVPVGSYPVHATTHSKTTFIATMGDRAITAIEPSGGVRTIATGVLGPSHFASAADKLFVSCTAGDVLAVIDPHTLTLTDRIAVGAAPHEVAVSPDESRLYSGSRRDGVVDVIDTESHQRIAAVDIGAAARVQGVAVSPNGDRGYAVDQQNARIVAFDPNLAEQPSGGSTDESAADATAPIGADPYDLVVTANRVFVPGRGDGTVHEFDSDLTLVRVHDGFDRPIDLFLIDDNWWVLDAAASRLQSLDGDCIETAAPGLYALRVGDRLVVSHYDDDCVSLVDLETGPVWVTESPSYPFGSVVV